MLNGWPPFLAIDPPLPQTWDEFIGINAAYGNGVEAVAALVADYRERNSHGRHVAWMPGA